MEKGKLYYLASPYSHEDGRVRYRRSEDAALAVARLLKKGYWVFGPICHSCWPDSYFEDGEYDWMPLDLEILKRCDGLIVLKLEGWEKSKGVGMEIDFAARMGMPIEFMTEKEVMDVI